MLGDISAKWCGGTINDFWNANEFNTINGGTRDKYFDKIAWQVQNIYYIIHTARGRQKSKTFVFYDILFNTFEDFKKIKKY